MSDERTVLREIAWRDLCPWLLLFRTFRLSISLPLLLLATAGTLLSPLGWWAGEQLVLPGDPVERDAQFEQVVDYQGRSLIDRSDLPEWSWPRLRSQFNIQSPARFWDHTQQLLQTEWTLGRRTYLLLGGLWKLLVWSFFGAAITRIAVVKLGADERVGLAEALRFTRRRFLYYFIAPLSPLLLMLALGLIVAIFFGLLMWLDVGVLLVGIVWGLALLVGLLMAMLLLGVLLGWPLMWPAISAEERGDAFDAWSRSYSYTLHRPLHYLAYALLALTLGLLGWLLVFAFSELVVTLSYEAATLVLSDERERALYQAWLGRPESSTLLRTAVDLLALWTGLVRTVAAAYGYSFFFCAASGIYLLLRRVHDQSELDEVYLDDSPEPQSLPPLATDAEGVAGVADEAPE